MTKKEYEGIKRKLNRYRELRGRVGRLTEEAARWNAMAELSVPELRRAGGGRGVHREMGEVKSSALIIEEERDRLAREAMAQRRQLMELFSRLEDSAGRGILEQVYITGSTVREVAGALDVTEKTVLRKLRGAAEALARLGEL